MGDNDRKRDVLNRVLKALIVELRKILKRVAPGYYRRFPNAGRPCHTCAFNPATDNDQGFDSTIGGLMRCIYDDQPFYCHENIPWKKPTEEWTPEDHRHFKEHAQLCSGFAILLCPDANRDAKRALIKVARSHRAELNEVVEAGRLVL
jgi:hypothetical protein